MSKYNRVRQDRFLFQAGVGGGVVVPEPEGAGTGNPIGGGGVLAPEPETTADANNTNVVRGRVLTPSGQPVGGAAVTVVNRCLRKEDVLAQGTTRPDGRYELAFARGTNALDRRNVDLVVKVLPRGQDTPDESPVVFNARPEEVVDVVVKAASGPSEYEYLFSELSSLLIDQCDDGQLTIADLIETNEQRDISFIAGRAGRLPAQIAFMVAAEKLGQEEQLLPPDALYGFFRQGLSVNQRSLGLQSADRLFASLSAATSAGYTAPRTPAEVLTLVHRFRKDAIGREVGQHAPMPNGSLGALLRVAMPRAADREAFLDAYTNRPASLPEFWQAAAVNPLLKKQIPNTQLALQLGALTGNHEPLVKQLYKVLHDGQKLKPLSELGSISPSDWDKWINDAGEPPSAAPGDTAWKERYTRTIGMIVEDAFPTAVLARRIKGDSALGIKATQDWLESNRHQLDLHTVNIDQLLPVNPGESDEDKTRRAELKSLQRLQKLTPRFDELRALKTAGFDSAYAIARTGRNAFVTRFAPEMGAAHARVLHERATLAANRAVTYLADLAPPFNSATPRVLQCAEPTNTGLPDWEALFGSIDYCDCVHCRSVYGPAAYLVDLLAFLNERPSEKTIKNAEGKDVPAPVTHMLFGTRALDLIPRRPDLGEIELTCVNTNTTLPYVDLVNECLEHWIAPFAEIDLDIGLATLLPDTDSPRKATEDAFATLRSAFEMAGRPLSADAIVMMIKPGTRWAVTDGGRRFAIDKAGEKLAVQSMTLQTTRDAQELRANPEHVNAAAYETLRAAVYPWGLPLDLWWEEAQTYLSHLGVPRRQLMEAFQRDVSTPLPIDVTLPGPLDVAGESLAVPDAERKRMTGPASAVETVYGFTAGQVGWAAEIASVREFMRRSGMTFDELTALLEMRSLYDAAADPTARLEIAARQDAHVHPLTCDTSQLILQHRNSTGTVPLTDADVPLLDRIHRFVRLWRRLGWTMREVDRAIVALSPGRRIDTDLIRKLADVKRLAAELEAPLSHVLALFAPLDTYAYAPSLDGATYAGAADPGERPLYDELFLNPALVERGADNAFALNLDRTELAAVGSLADANVAAALLAALRIRDDDLTALVSGPYRVIAASDDATYPLNLDNLSRIARAVFVSRGLGMTIDELLRLVDLRGIAPFSNDQEGERDFWRAGRISDGLAGPVGPEETSKTRALVADMRAIADAGLTGIDVEVILRGRHDPASTVVPPEDILLTLLDEIRAGLQGVKEATSEREDAKGDLTRKQLALLKWDAAQIDLVVGTLLGTATYSVDPQTLLEAIVTFPESLTFAETLTTDPDHPHPQEEQWQEILKRISYTANDAQSKTLNFAGVMTAQQRPLLLAHPPGELTSDVLKSRYEASVEALFTAPRSAVTVRMRSFSVPSFRAPLDIIPGNLRSPKSLGRRFVRDFGAGELVFAGYMTDAERQELRDLITDDTVFETPLAALPAGLALPGDIAIVHDAVDAQLRFTGVMSAHERAMLTALSTDLTYLAAIEALFAAKPAYEAAIDVLFDGPATFVPDPDDTFLGLADQQAMFPDTCDVEPCGLMPVEERFRLVLAKLQPHLKRTLSAALVKQKVGGAIGLDSASGEALLDRWLRCPNDRHGDLPAIHEFLAPAFAESDPAVPLTARAAAQQLNALTRAFKVAFVLNMLEIGADQFGWLFDKAPADWLDLNQLPVAVPEEPIPTDRFAGWMRLLALRRLRDGLPRGNAVLSRIFDLARNADASSATIAEALKTALVEETGWGQTDVEFLTGSGGFNLLLPGAFTDEAALLRLMDAFAVLRRLGVSAQRAITWTRHELGEQEAREIRQAAKARYELSEWLDIAPPLRDELREKQRAALVAYCVARPPIVEDVPLWEDADGLYAHFLIDVEMSPCQLTSRIKQAIGSVQLFVQRCLLNLGEKWIKAHVDVDEKWAQWTWMKNYRVWEANRKVFLYPENWIEPGLRSDKTPFFAALEDALNQKEITRESTEEAFLAYLTELDTVGRLDIRGVYHLKEDLEGFPAVDVLHIFGRTRNSPYQYFHRTLTGGKWTPWEKVELDIEGDHLIPVVWNRRLYLFWPVFTEKTKPKPVAIQLETTVPDSESDTVKLDTTLPDPDKFLQVRLALSEHRNGKWRSKRLSRQYLESPIVPPGSNNHEKTEYAAFPAPQIKRLTFRSTIDKDSGDLFVLCLGMGSGVVGAFRLRGCNGQIESYSQERVQEALGIQVSGDDQYHIIPPKNTFVQYMGFEQYLQSADEAEFDWIDELHLPTPNTTAESAQLLRRIPGSGPYRLLVPHQHEQFRSQAPFFYDDDSSTFFVAPKYDPNWVIHPATGWKYGLDIWADVGGSLHDRYQKSPLYDDPKGPLVNPPRYGFDGLLNQNVAKFTVVNQLVNFAPDAEVGTEKFLSPSTSLANVDYLASPGFTGSFKPQLEYQPTHADYWGSIDPKLIYGGLTINDVKWWEDPETTYRFDLFYHPYTCLFTKQLNRLGLGGLLKRDVQTEPDTLRDPGSPAPVDFKAAYGPSGVVSRFPQAETVDFDGGPYSQYNWELFFHAPLHIATRLSQNQRFEEAQQWFHTIFDPTDVSTENIPQRYWRTKPFFERTAQDYCDQRIDALLQHLAESMAPNGAEPHGTVKAFKLAIEDWAANPFDPHRIAQARTTAYQKTVVMKYLDNLIAWGDALFRRDTIESINEATQLYLMAADILGARPVRVNRKVAPQVRTYNDLAAAPLDDFANALVAAEHLVSVDGPPTVSFGPAPADLTLPSLLYFCVPHNDILLGYWDTVADRLFKIRHCMNIEGVTRQLALFEPPIDPALLVRATAAGLDLGTILNDLNASLPHYRFSIMLARALELCAEVRSLGAAMLSALEKRDAEALALLRSSQEITLLSAVRAVKQSQITDAERTLESLHKARDLAQIRRTYYTTREFMNAGEKAHLASVSAANSLQTLAAGFDLTASEVSLTPDTKIGAGTTFGATFGGAQLGQMLRSLAGRMSMMAGSIHAEAGMSATMAGYQRRADDWQLQADSAAKEIEQLDKQITAAEIRVAIAERDLENHDLQVENAKEADFFLRDKFTNRELYDWMVGQLSTVYFQCYQLAYDVAKRSEQCYRHELGVADSAFVQFGYWDSLRKGLLAGERLFYDLKRMEISYLEENRREFEITKRISLAMLDPAAPLSLKQTGECFVSLPEALFDLDCPGHYMRRLKRVGLTIPCVAGPYTSVNCTLTHLRSSVRTNANLFGGTKHARQANDPRFRDASGSIQAIVTSTGQDDTGLFEPNLRDERYLPFEGAGAISDWHLRLPNPHDFPQFDYDTISDIVLTISYTARDGGDPLRGQAVSELKQAANELALANGRRGLFQMFSARHEYVNEWIRFTNPNPANGSHELALTVDQTRFPLVYRNRGVKVDKLQVVLVLRDDPADSAIPAFTAGDSLKLVTPQAEDGKMELSAPAGQDSRQLIGSANLKSDHQDVALSLSFTVDETEVPAALKTDDKLNPHAIQDLFVIAHYRIT
jgi:hypothetical protein